MGLKRMGGPLLERTGITRLSELIIDADKNWQAQGISNIEELAAAMDIGDLLSHNGAVIVRLVPGAPGTLLTSAGAGNPLTWSHP